MVARLEMLLAVFAKPESGAQALAELRAMERSGRLSLHDAAVLRPSRGEQGAQTGEADPEQDQGSTDRSASLLGNVFAQIKGPASQTIGKAVGTVTGGTAGNGATLGFDRQTLAGLTAVLPESTSAILAVVEEGSVDEVAEFFDSRKARVFRQDKHQSMAAQLREADLPGTEGTSESTDPT